MIAMEAMGKISNYKTSEYLRSGNAGVEDKNKDKQEEANKNGLCYTEYCSEIFTGIQDRFHFNNSQNNS